MRQRSRGSAAAGVVLAAVLGLPDQSVARTKRVQQISADPLPSAGGFEHDGEAEPHVAIDPNDPSRLVAIVMVERFQAGGHRALAYAASDDGGVTWTSGILPGITTAAGGPFFLTTDPTVAFGPDGTAYAQMIGILGSIDGTCQHAVLVLRSEDGGRTFGTPRTVAQVPCGGELPDKGWLVVDAGLQSPYRGRLYVFWVSGVRYSDDRGDTWTSLSAGIPQDASHMPVIGPDGAVTIVHDGSTGTSHDGGVSYLGPATEHFLVGQPFEVFGSGFPSATADPVTGQLYLVWQDGRLRRTRGNDVAFLTSTDGGASWSGLRFINPDPGDDAHDFITPTIAAYGGVVYVTWQTMTKGRRISLRYVASTDGGVTFARQRRIGRAGDALFAAHGGTFVGHYMGLAATPNGAQAVWCRPSPAAAIPHQTTWAAFIPRPAR